MEEYRTYTLEELSIGKGSYGIAASAVPFDATLHTYLRITDINDDGSLNKSGLMSVDEGDAEKYLLKPNDIVFARTGNSTGRSYFYDGSDGELVYAGFLIKFSLDSAKVNPRILKYYTHSKPYYDWVQSFGTGSTRGNINAKTYGKMPITLPPRDIQDKIVDMLKSLDDKIEVNRQINDNFYYAFFEVMLVWSLTSLENDNLEQQAMALFKSWFVDFEPFKDSEFEEMEQGSIPKGWKAGTLEDITAQKTERVGGRDDVKVLSPVTTGRLMLSEEFFTKQVFSESIAKYKVVEIGDFAYNPARVNIGSLGRNNYDFDGCVSPVYVVFSCKDGYAHLFDLYRKTEKFKTEVNLRAIGGVRQSLNYKDFAFIQCVIPPPHVVEEFNAIYNHLLVMQKHTDDESERLASLRDTLLPKLMSGEMNLEKEIV